MSLFNGDGGDDDKSLMLPLLDFDDKEEIHVGDAEGSKGKGILHRYFALPKALRKAKMDVDDTEENTGDAERSKGKGILHRYFADLRIAYKVIKSHHLSNPLSWVSVPTIQALQSGNVRRRGQLIALFHRGAWRKLPPGILPLNRRTGIGAFSDGDSLHCKVVCLKATRNLGQPFYLEWSCYSSRTHQWMQMNPLELGWKEMRTKNLLISNDGRTIYLASNYGVDPPYIVSIDIMEQRTTILYLHPDKYLHPEEEWLDTDEFAISKFGYSNPTEKDLCMLRYSSFSKIFSVWVLLYNQQEWIKLHQVSTVDSLFNWSSPVKCFAIVRIQSLVVMAMQDGGLYSYHLQYKRFTKLEPTILPYCFPGLNGVC